jgi:hypothetical protein
VSIDISSYHIIALGKEDDSDDEDNIIEYEKEASDNRDSKNNDVDNDLRGDTEEKDSEDVSLDKLFGNNDDNDNSDSKDNGVTEKNKEKEEEEKEDEVPFILPFKAVPFP